MKKAAILLTIAATIICLTITACSSEPSNGEASVQPQAEAGDIEWHEYDEGMALGKKEDKKVLLHFYADWCTYCKKMDKEIFSDGEAAEFINQNFVPIRIDSDAEQQLTASYRVSGLPTTYFLDKTGEPIQSLPGYLPKEMFMAYMKFVQTDSYQSMTFKKFMGVE